jgi:dephospho-CoA kinase
MLIVGLTGGIGSGKSTVAAHFVAMGVTCIDADQIARDVVQLGEPALVSLVQHFGNIIINADGSLNRRVLREKIFADPAARTWVNNLLHPLIRQKMLQQCHASNGPYCILMVPLLFENNLQSLVHRTLVVDVDENTQIRRTMQRDQTTEAQVKAILNAQCSRQHRLDLADDIINNSDGITIEQREQQINRLHQKYLQLAAQVHSPSNMV